MLKVIVSAPLLFAARLEGAVLHISGPNERQVVFGDGTTSFATLSGGEGSINSTATVRAPDLVTMTGASVNEHERRLAEIDGRTIQTRLASIESMLAAQTQGSCQPAPERSRIASIHCSGLSNGFTCALTAITGGYLTKCWGSNRVGQLGLGDKTDRDKPTNVTALGDMAVELGVGDQHACALVRGGKVMCWGHNGYGQLGLGDQVDRMLPTEVATLGSNAARLYVGGGHTCVKMNDETVWCWGYNGRGTLGLGDKVNRNVPTTVAAFGTNVKELFLSAHLGSTCAMMKDETVKCMGWNGYGHLGLGHKTDTVSPTTVTALGTNTVQFAAGYEHSCALLKDETVKCVGRRYGNGQNRQDNSWATIASLTGEVTDMRAYSYYTCAMLKDRSIKCWGEGYLRAGFARENRAGPISALPSGMMIANDSKIAVGYSHSCTILEAGELACWGDNAFGQLGRPELPPTLI